MSAGTAKTVNMTEGKPLQLMARFALPVLIGNAFQQVYTLADTVIAGHFLGSHAIAAIGSTGIFFSLLMSLARGLNIGYGVVLSRTFGSGDEARLRRSTAAMIGLNGAAALFLTVLSLLVLRPVLVLMQTPEDIFSEAYAYISVVLAGMAATVAYNACAGYLTSLGNSRTPLVFLIFSSLLNLALDALFIVGLKTGIAGAAWATVIAQGVSAVLCGTYIRINYRSLLPRVGDWRPESDLLREMSVTGLSMALMESVVSLGTVLFQRAVNALGTAAITANTAARRAYDVLQLPIGALTHADSVFVSQNYGAGKIRRIAEGNRQAMGVIALWSLAAFAVCWIGGRPLALWLTAGADQWTVSRALLSMRLSTACFFPLGALFIFRYSMQSMGHKVIPVLSSAIELGAKIASAAFIIPAWGYPGVAATEPVIWCVCAVFLGVFYFTRGRQRQKED